MNSKQRKAKIKQKLAMADVFVELVEQVLTDIDNGTTTNDVRAEMGEIKEQLAAFKVNKQMVG